MTSRRTRKRKRREDKETEQKSYRRRRHEEERDEREPKTTRRKRTKDNETEERRDERVLLDRVVDRLGGLSWWPSGRPVLDPPKTLEMSPGPARTQNRPILNKICIEKYTDFDGRRIREFCPSRTRPDLVLFRALGGIDSSRAAARSRPASSAASAPQSSPQALPCTRTDLGL